MNRSRVSPRSAVVALAAASAMLLAGCTATASAHWQGASDPTGAPIGGGPGATPATGPTALAISPAANAKNVAPGKPVVVTTTGKATVTSVTLRTGSRTLKGAMSADSHSWTSTSKLSFGTKYTLTVATTGLPSNTTTRTFTTVQPARTANASLQANALLALDNGGTYGIGEPVIVHFSRPVPANAQAGVAQSLIVTTTPAVEGRWHWIDSQNVHYRGENYWAAGSTIKINANVYGISLGNGTYGARDVSATIHIGDSHIAIANNKTHHMKVYINGKMVKNIPISMGRGGVIDGGDGNKINLFTRNGPHVVINKTPFTMMSSASFGLVDKSSPLYYPPVKIFDTVRVSYSGEFVHLRTWSTFQIGHANTSHGCINVGQGNAQYMYKLLIPGDVVDVTGSPIELPVTDGLGDWTISWAKW